MDFGTDKSILISDLMDELNIIYPEIKEVPHLVLSKHCKIYECYPDNRNKKGQTYIIILSLDGIHVELSTTSKDLPIVYNTIRSSVYSSINLSLIALNGKTYIISHTDEPKIIEFDVQLKVLTAAGRSVYLVEDDKRPDEEKRFVMIQEDGTILFDTIITEYGIWTVLFAPSSICWVRPIEALEDHSGMKLGPERILIHQGGTIEPLKLAIGRREAFKAKVRRHMRNSY